MTDTELFADRVFTDESEIPVSEDYFVLRSQENQFFAADNADLVNSEFTRQVKLSGDKSAYVVNLSELRSAPDERSIGVIPNLVRYMYDTLAHFSTELNTGVQNASDQQGSTLSKKELQRIEFYMREAKAADTFLEGRTGTGEDIRKMLDRDFGIKGEDGKRPGMSTAENWIIARRNYYQKQKEELAKRLKDYGL